MVDVLEVRRVDKAQLSHEPVEQDRVGPRAAGEKVYALQDLAVGHPGRHKSDVVAAGQILGSVDATLVRDTHLLRTAALLFITEAKPSEYFRAEAPQSSRGEHAFRRTARTHYRVHVSSRDVYLWPLTAADPLSDE